jgi:hypothetical protein
MQHSSLSRSLSGCSIVLMALLTLLMSCEKEVKINLNSAPPKLVVEGFIEKDYPPVVVLTRSIGYFSKIDLSTLSNSFVHNAIVTVDNGSRKVTLREYSIDTSGGNKLYFYTLDTAGGIGLNFFRGETNKSYTLTIEADGNRYESITKIPACKPVDSLIAEAPATPPDKLPTAMILAVYYSDPDTFGNCVRYFTKRNSEPFYPGFNSVYDDQIVNGAQNARLPIAAGFRRTGSFSDSSGYVFRGDTITLKWSAIDRGVFNFYTTYEYSLGTTGNPFSTPINVKSNISNGALGVWAGYGTTTTTLIIPK